MAGARAGVGVGMTHHPQSPPATPAHPSLCVAVVAAAALARPGTEIGARRHPLADVAAASPPGQRTRQAVRCSRGRTQQAP